MIEKHPTLFGVLCGVAYGLIIQVAARTGHLKQILSVMAFGFVFVLPFALGFITAYVAGKGKAKRVWAYLAAPQATIMACLVAAMIIGWEGLICLVMALPVYAFMGALGGLAAWMAARVNGNNMALASFVALLPPSSAALEHMLPPRVITHHVHTQITIDAAPAVVWEKIVRVEPIAEPLTGFFYRMGFPKPIDALLSYEGVGGVRQARFEKNLVFIETVDEWSPGERFSFNIEVDPAHTPVTTLDPHVTVGGEYFDVMRGTYWLEPRQTDVVLHLESSFRLSTAFNTYAGLWGDFLMRDIQNSILQVIKTRSESTASAGIVAK